MNKELRTWTCNDIGPDFEIPNSLLKESSALPPLENCPASVVEVITASAHSQTDKLIELLDKDGTLESPINALALEVLLLNPVDNCKGILAQISTGDVDNPKVTPSGRARVTAVHKETANVPEKTIRAWIIRRILLNNHVSSNVDLYWPRIIPAVLILMDSTDLSLRSKGCELTELIAVKFPKRLVSMGLLEVFWMAAIPSINFLPPMVDAKDVKKLHWPAVRAMTELSLIEDVMIKRHFVFIEGCVKALQHTGENVELTISFMDTLSWTCEKLGPIVIAHIGRTLPLLVKVLTDPFLDYSPELSSSTTRALASVVTNAWPRLSEYRYDIALGLIKAKTFPQFSQLVGSKCDETEISPDKVVKFLEALH